MCIEKKRIARQRFGTRILFFNVKEGFLYEYDHSECQKKGAIDS